MACVPKLVKLMQWHVCLLQTSSVLKDVGRICSFTVTELSVVSFNVQLNKEMLATCVFPTIILSLSPKYEKLNLSKTINQIAAKNIKNTIQFEAYLSTQFL